MNCESCRQSLSSYLDEELSPDERGLIDAHLAECADCRARWASLRAVKHAVARLRAREEPPAAIRAHIESLRLKRDRASATAMIRRVWVPLVGLAAAATVFVLMRPIAPPPSLTTELVADHLRSIPPERPPEVVSRDPQQVVRFFEGHVAFSPVVPTLPGSTLVGGRLCTIQGRLGQLLFYETSGETLSLFVGDRSFAYDGCREASAHQVCGRTWHDLGLLLIGRLPPHTLRHLLSGATL